MRLIEIIKSVPQHLLTAPNLMALMQGLATEEMGYAPLVNGTKESIRSNQASQRFATEITRALQDHARRHPRILWSVQTGDSVVRLDIGRQLDQIEAEFSTNTYFGRIEYGDVRRFADTTRFHLQSASDIIAILLLDRNPHAELPTLLGQLEVGLP